MGSDAPEVDEPAPPPPERRGSARRKTVLVLVLVAAIAAGLLWSGKSEPPPVMVLPPHTVLKHNPLPDRWIPRSWGWMWRARDMILGQRRAVDLRARILQLSEPLPLPNSLPIPTLVTNGIRAWILPAAEFDVLSQRLTQKVGAKSKGFNPVIRTAHGIIAWTTMGNTVQLAHGYDTVGFTIQTLTIVQERKTDLSFMVKSTEIAETPAGANAESGSHPTLRTNLLQVLRAQIPKGGALAVLQEPVEGRPGCVILLKVDLK